MEESSISSSRTAGASFFYRDVDCYASGGPHAAAEASEESGWTAYFYDDDGDKYLPLQASEDEPAAAREKKPHRHGHGHGDRASASTVSTASKTKARAKKEVAKEEKKKRPRYWEPADEDPLQDTASSLPPNATHPVQLQDGWQTAGCCEQRSSSDTALQWIDWLQPAGEAHGITGTGQMQKRGVCMLN
uniref:Uncharacterized protein n=1 Tax=Avena sativa TaxID=4498 RepID=A0ACD5UNF0_AVESA